MTIIEPSAGYRIGYELSGEAQVKALVAVAKEEGGAKAVVNTAEQCIDVTFDASFSDRSDAHIIVMAYDLENHVIVKPIFFTTSASSQITISTKEELLQFAANVNAGAVPAGMEVLLTADIDMSGYNEVDGWYETQEGAESYDDNEYISGQPAGSFEAVYGTASIATVTGTISEGSGITLYIDGKTINNFALVYQGVSYGYYLEIGTHTITWDINSGYNGDNVTANFNGQTVTNGGTITVTAEMTTFTLSASGATPGQIVVDGGNGGSSDMGLTDYLLIILVILIVVMAIIVALRLMRS